MPARVARLLMEAEIPYFLFQAGRNRNFVGCNCLLGSGGSPWGGARAVGLGEREAPGGCGCVHEIGRGRVNAELDEGTLQPGFWRATRTRSPLAMADSRRMRFRYRAHISRAARMFRLASTKTSAEGQVTAIAPPTTERCRRGRCRRSRRGTGGHL